MQKKTHTLLRVMPANSACSVQTMSLPHGSSVPPFLSRKQWLGTLLLACDSPIFTGQPELP